MPLATVKILSDDDTGDLATKLATYVAGAGSDLADAQRAMASGHFEEVDGDARTILALAHGGLDTPASGAKVGDLVHSVVRAKGSEAEMQAAVDAALADVAHETQADVDTTVAGTVTSVLMTFEAEDVGRKFRLSTGEEVVITAFTDSSNVDYDVNAPEGTLPSGTGLTGSLLGAEIVQDLSMTAMKKDAKNEMLLVMACSGELAQ